ncbi:MAG TPA: 50S ribosomal protein L25/general stress protein Ctc [Burkholderiales bacterium]|nr:50S ribosomal protein L25/general stress protein Ctc [Burkholderiales bacterium]
MEVTAAPRSVQGTGASRRLRRAGRVPGIVYGADLPAQVIELDHNALYLQLRQEAFHASILNMNLEGRTERVLLRGVQMHPWKPQVLHVDFQRVSANQKIHMKVPLHFKNAEVSPGVKAGGIVAHVMSDIEISCLPDDLPEFIEVDLSTLQLGHSVHISDLTLPKGVESVQLVRGDDAVVATVQIPKVIEEVEAVTAAPAEGAEVPVEGAAPAAAPAAAAGEKKEGEKKEGEKK